MMRGMVIDMDEQQLRTLTQLQGFLDGTVAVEFALAAASALRLHFPHAAPLWLWRPEPSRQARGVAFPAAGQRLLAPTAHAAG